MSWSVSVPATPAEGIAQAVAEAQLPADTYNKPELIKQWQEQLEAAKDAALSILGLHPFGEGGTYSVNMSGHAAHDGLAESAGYTPSEFVNVGVSRQP